MKYHRTIPIIMRHENEIERAKKRKASREEIHDINNKYAVILCRAELANEEYSKKSEYLKKLANIHEVSYQ